MKTTEDIAGLEYDWLAVDEDGFVGMFSTAGGGRAPQAFLHETDVHDLGLDALMTSQVTTEARFFPQVAKGLVNPWKIAAERGVFAFDGDPFGGPYRLVGRPKAPAHARELPANSARAAMTVVLGGVRFSELHGEGSVLDVP